MRAADLSTQPEFLSAYNSVKKKQRKTRVHQETDLVEICPKIIDLRQNSSIQPSYDLHGFEVSGVADHGAADEASALAQVRNVYIRNVNQTLKGSFSAVWTATIARVGSFFSIFRDLQDYHSFAPLRPQKFSF